MINFNVKARPGAATTTSRQGPSSSAAASPAPPPPTTAHGALIAHITGGHMAGGKFQPMNINYGLMPPIEAPRVEGKRAARKDAGALRKRAISLRALADLDAWLRPRSCECHPDAPAVSELS